MPSKEDFAQWIVDNRDLKGTPGFDTVAGAYRKLVEEENVTPNPLDSMSSGQEFLAGAGKAFTDLGRGAGQMIGLVSDEDVEESRRIDENLMDSGFGVAGNITGNMAALAPAMMIPGANTYAGAATAGAITGALQPTTEDESRLLNTAAGAGLGVAGQYGGNQVATLLRNKGAQRGAAQSTNELRDTILREGVEEGYSVTPTQAGGGRMSQLGQALSGKYKTQELAQLRNQPVTNSLARQSIGLADDTPISLESLREVRRQAVASGYDPVRSAGQIITDDKFVSSLDDVVAQFRGAAGSFPDAVADDVMTAVDNLRVNAFDAADAMDMIKVLRGQADTAFRSGDSQMGGVYRKGASAIEDQIERHLTAAGDDGVQMLTEFRNARQLMAKTYSIEKAVNQGGNVDAQSLASQLRRGAPLSDELKQIGQFGDQFRGVSRVPEGQTASPFTIFDAMVGMGGSAASGSPLPMVLAGARPAARQAILSPVVQRAMANKSYDPSMIARLLSLPAANTAIRAAPIAAGATANAN